MTPQSPPMVAILIKTLRRERAFLNCIRSVREHIRVPHRFYIADDGPASSIKEQLYTELQNDGHRVLRFPTRTGASQSRNALLAILGAEKYVLRLDDDFELTPATDVPGMIQLVERQPEIGAVADLERQIGSGKGVFSGEISPAQGLLEIRDGTLVKRLIPLSEFEYRESGGLRYAYCEFSRNFLLVRREVFRNICWEEELPFAGEHADFLLQLKTAGWKLAFLPGSIHLHREDLSRLDVDRIHYRREKTGWETIMPVYRRKWGVHVIRIKRPARYFVKAAIVRAVAPILHRLETRPARLPVW